MRSLFSFSRGLRAFSRKLRLVCGALRTWTEEMVHGNVEFWSIWDTGRISLMPQTNVIDSHSTDQFSKASLGLLVDVAYPLIDSLLALLQHLFVYLRVSKPVEDLCKQDIINMVSRMVQSRAGQNIPHLRRWVRKPLRLLQQLSTASVKGRQPPLLLPLKRFFVRFVLRPFCLFCNLRGFNFPQN